MSDERLDLEQELEHLRDELARSKNQLALLQEKLRLSQQETNALQQDFRLRAEAEELSDFVCERVLKLAKGKQALQPVDGWHRTYVLQPSGILISVDYLQDTNLSDEHDLTLVLPFGFVHSVLRSRQPSFELVVLGGSRTVLVVPGGDLWGWMGDGFEWWYQGELRYSFKHRPSAGEIWLIHVQQTRPWGRGNQWNWCRTEQMDVTRYLNRYDLLTSEEG